MEKALIEKPVFPKRNPFTHKGDYGKALNISGSYGMTGAAFLSGKAALRSGVGLLKTAVPDTVYGVLAPVLPESVLIPLKTENGEVCRDEMSRLASEIKTADAVLVGCGLGKSKTARMLFETALEYSTGTLIIDADGINILSENINIVRQSSADIIITPHSGEMARLFGVTPSEIEADREKYVIKAATEFNVTAVLKGHETLVASKDGRLFYNTTGNPGMATGGSGDTLSGIILGLSATGYDALSSATKGVYIHGLAGDLALKKVSETSLLPTDILDTLPECF